MKRLLLPLLILNVFFVATPIVAQDNIKLDSSKIEQIIIGGVESGSMDSVRIISVNMDPENNSITLIVAQGNSDENGVFTKSPLFENRSIRINDIRTTDAEGVPTTVMQVITPYSAAPIILTNTQRNTVLIWMQQTRALFTNGLAAIGAVPGTSQ